jgi:hypothetical protein
MDSWRTHSINPPNPLARSSHNIVKLDNGELLIIGGYALSTLETVLTAVIPVGKTNEGELGALCQRYNPATGELKDACPMPSDNAAHSLGGRADLCAVKLRDGTVLAGGGQNQDIDDSPLNIGLTDTDIWWSDFWIYDPAVDDWTATTSAPETMNFSTQPVLLDDGRLLCAAFVSPSNTTWISGSGSSTQDKIRYPMSLHTYTRETDGTWTQHGDLDQRRSHAKMVKLTNGNVIIVGGMPDFAVQGLSILTCAIWDKTTGLWTQTAAMPAIPEEEHTSAATIGPAALTSIVNGSALFGVQYPPVINVRVDGLVPTQRYIGGTIALSGTTNSVTGLGASFAKAGNIVTYTKSTGTSFLTVGSPEVFITIAGSTSPGNDGTFRILSVTGATALTYLNAAGVAEAHSGSWTIKRNDCLATIFTVLHDTAGAFSRIYFYNEAGLSQAAAGGTYTITEVTPGGRYQPMVAALPNNKVLIAGGNRPPCLAEGGSGGVSLTAGVYTDLVPNSESMRKSVLVFDATLGTYARVQDMKLARNGGEAIPLPNGQVLLIGGVTFNLGKTASCEIFDPATGRMLDGALLDPIVDGNGNFVMFDGVAGNPPSGTSPAPGFVESNESAGNHYALRVLSSSWSKIFSVMGAAAAGLSSNRISSYSVGVPSKGNSLERIP